MRKYLKMIVLACCLPVCAYADIELAPCYTEDQPIIVHFKYSGGDKRWDAAFGLDQNNVLVLGNNAVFSLHEDRGNVMKPKDGRTMRLHRNTRMTGPVDVRVDIKQVYPDLKPGTYVLTWGSQGGRGGDDAAERTLVKTFIFEITP